MSNVNRLLATLADPTRAAILVRLGRGPASVTEIATVVPVSQPAVSHHLARLREDGLVTVKAKVVRRIYQIDPAGFGPCANGCRGCGARTCRPSRPPPKRITGRSRNS